VIYVLRYLLVALYTVIWGTLALVVFFDRSGRGIMWVARSWVRWILASCGVRVEVEGLENVHPTRGCIYMSNHQSVFDIVAIVHTLPVSWKFVAKRELLRIPFFGWALAAADQVIIDRSNRQASIRSLARAAERVRGGANVIMFPEGTRSRDAVLHGFKSGGFHLAIQSQAPVVPITVSGSWRITPKKSLRIESGRLSIRYGTPIPTEGLTVDDRSRLKEQVRQAILAGYDADLQGPPLERSRAAPERSRRGRTGGHVHQA
jgi:1-acyl-sn-glycerol-3-phosphate acyltransferase